MTPTTYSIQNPAHAAKFGLQPKEVAYLLGRCNPNRHGARPEFIVCHVQDGNTRGSLEHFANGYYPNGKRVAASCTVLVQQDGSIFQYIDERHGPWTNGGIKNPKAASKELRDRAGTLGVEVNDLCLTIEAEGTPWGAHSEAQLRSIMWQIEQWRTRYLIRDTRRILEHADIDSVNRANCAGAYYDRIRAWLDGAKPPIGTDPRFGTVVEFPEPVRITCIVDELNVRQWGETDAAIVDTMTHGENAWADGYVIGDDVAGENRWYTLAGRGWRVWAGGTDRIALPKAA